MNMICVDCGFYSLTNGAEYTVREKNAYSYWVTDDDGDRVFVSKNRFVAPIQTNKQTMKIGDKVIPVDIAGTSSLDSNKEYVVVDINSHGNIGLKDPAAGCLLEHYYKPERLKLAPTRPKVEVGQIYQYNYEISPRNKGYYLVYGWPSRGYNLISLNGVGSWTPTKDSINDIFGRQGIERFELVENPFK